MSKQQYLYFDQSDRIPIQIGDQYHDAATDIWKDTYDATQMPTGLKYRRPIAEPKPEPETRPTPMTPPERASINEFFMTQGEAISEPPIKSWYMFEAMEQAVKPTVVCLCGSSKFPMDHMQVMMIETLKGRIVIPLGLYGHADFPTGARVATNDGDEATEVKQMLDRLHFAKIDLADEILVVAVGGYIGSSTKREIEYATSKGKKVRTIEPAPYDKPTGPEALASALAEIDRYKAVWSDPAALHVNLLRSPLCSEMRDKFLHLAGANDYDTLKQLAGDAPALIERLKELERTLEKEIRAEKVEAERKKLTAENAKLEKDFKMYRGMFTRIKDQIIAGHGPEEMFRWQEALSANDRGDGRVDAVAALIAYFYKLCSAKDRCQKEATERQARIDALEAEVARLREVQEKASALVARLKYVHDDPKYQSVWTLAQVHGYPYIGPKYTDELNALNAALAEGGKL
jgi:hypothetical protein